MAVNHSTIHFGDTHQQNSKERKKDTLRRYGSSRLWTILSPMVTVPTVVTGLVRGLISSSMRVTSSSVSLVRSVPLLVLVEMRLLGGSVSPGRLLGLLRRVDAWCWWLVSRIEWTIFSLFGLLVGSIGSLWTWRTMWLRRIPSKLF